MKGLKFSSFNHAGECMDAWIEMNFIHSIERRRKHRHTHTHTHTHNIYTTGGAVPYPWGFNLRLVDWTGQACSRCHWSAVRRVVSHSMHA